MERMTLNGPEICDIEMSFKIVANHIVHHMFAVLVLGLKLDGVDKLGNLINIMLVKRNTANTRRVAFHDQWPVFQVRLDERKHMSVIPDQVRFRVTLVRPIDPVETRKTDSIFSDLHTVVALQIL